MQVSSLKLAFILVLVDFVGQSRREGTEATIRSWTLVTHEYSCRLHM